MTYTPVHAYGGLEHDQPSPIDGCLLCSLDEANLDNDELSEGIATALAEVRSLTDELRQANFFRDSLARKLEATESALSRIEAVRDFHVSREVVEMRRIAREALGK
jgi:hypothetical protein